MGFWCKNLPTSATCYTPLELQLLAANWAILEVEALTGAGLVTLHTQLPIIFWVMETVPCRFGVATEISLLKWKWYPQDSAKPVLWHYPTCRGK